MRKCSKCQKSYDDVTRICRACGAIVDEVVDERPSVSVDPAPINPAQVDFAPPADDSFEEVVDTEVLRTRLAEAAASLPTSSGATWICTSCGERVPWSFDYCWNCEATAKDAALTRDDPDVAPPAVAAKVCAVCGSPRIIPGVTIADTGQYAAGTLGVAIEANPHAFIFKDRLRGEFVADICGDCGRAELRVRNPAELYEHFLRSKS